jgi:hypothetical protein
VRDVDPLQADPLQAAAEAQLERADDEVLLEDRDTQPEPEPPPNGVHEDEYGFHLDEPEGDLLEDDLDVGLRDDGEADALEDIAEAFNARDLERLLEIVAADGEAPGLLGYDVANLPDAIEELWLRRPNAFLTRGRTPTEDVGVLWEHDGTEWWKVAAVHVDDVADGQVGVLEFSEDGALLELADCEPPSVDDLEEGSRWIEWEEGTADR